MLFPRDGISAFANERRGERISTLNEVYDAILALDGELQTNEVDISPSILLEPYTFRDAAMYAVTGDAARQYFLSLGMAETQASTEASAIVGRTAVHQIRIRSLKQPMQVELERCGCPTIPLGVDAIDPMSFIMLGQQRSVDLVEHFKQYAMGLRRARRIRQMASRLVSDLLEQ